MTAVGWATLDIIPSVKGMRAQIEKQTSGDLSAAGKAGGRRFGDAAGVEAGKSFKSRFAGFAREAAAPLAGLAAGAAVVDIFKDAIAGASDLGESTTKVEVVFGKASDSVLEFADNAAKGLGQSETQALSAVGTFGNLLRSVGLTAKESAEFSTAMVALASDLASFNNTSVDDAIEALRAGLIGETEPLKRYGVNMNEAALKAKAMAMGLSDGKAALDANTKAQAAYSLIMEQTKLAQGDFARTSDGLANQQRILSAQWQEMTTSLGTQLLPAVTGFVSFMNDQGLPALGAAGGLARDAAEAFGDLPTPVKAAAAAFVALRIASATGITDSAAGGVSRASSALESLRIRTMLATDAYSDARTITREFAGTTARVSSGVGRASASLVGLRAAAQGAGGAITRGLSGAMGLLGGPWGIAIIGGTALLTKFWQEHEETKSRIDSMSAALDQQTGALTDRNRELAASTLQEEGVLKAAREAGISLETLTDAYLGNREAIAAVDEQVNTFRQSLAGMPADAAGADPALVSMSDAMTTVQTAIQGGNEELDRARDKFRDLSEAIGDNADAADRSGPSADRLIRRLRTYGTEVQAVRDDVAALLEIEKARTLANIQSRRDQIALKETFAAARTEAAEGARTLNTNTEAGRANMNVLLDLAEQWATSKASVKNARGAYEEMRQKFIEVAEKMGATRQQARKLAEDLLKVPRKAPIEFQSKGYRERMQEIRDIKAAMADLGSASLDYTPRGFGTPNGTGGPLSSPRSKPSPGTATDPRIPAGVVNNFNGPMHVADGRDLTRQAQRRAQQRGLGGRP